MLWQLARSLNPHRFRARQASTRSARMHRENAITVAGTGRCRRARNRITGCRTRRGPSGAVSVEDCPRDSRRTLVPLCRTRTAAIPGELGYAMFARARRATRKPSSRASTVGGFSTCSVSAPNGDLTRTVANSSRRVARLSLRLLVTTRLHGGAGFGPMRVRAEIRARAKRRLFGVAAGLRRSSLLARRRSAAVRGVLPRPDYRLANRRVVMA